MKDLPPLVMTVPLAILVDVQEKRDLSVVDQQNVHLGKERPKVVLWGFLSTLLGQPPEATQSSFPMLLHLIMSLIAPVVTCSDKMLLVLFLPEFS